MEACVSAVVVQGSLQLKAHFVSGKLINNSTAAQWDHKSVDGTLEDVSVTVYEPLLAVLGQPERFTHHNIC